jgi:hypothetical protein
VDFFEVMQFRDLGTEDYYDFLNLGIKLAMSAGSDVPWGGTIGEVRVYAQAGSPFSIDGWFDAVKQGRTFVTNGPMLSLSVNGAGPGDEVRVNSGETVQVQARGWAPSQIGPPSRLEVICHGEVLRSAESADPKQEELQLQFNMRPEESLWIAARVRSRNDGVAHTSPVYVSVGGGKFWKRERVPELVQKRLRILDYATARLGDEKYTAPYASGEIEALTERIQQARQIYETMLAERRIH